MQTSKKHAHDAQPVIEYARVWASEAEERRYVYSDGFNFVAVASQPSADTSHWCVLPDGECLAHVETNHKGEYHYEESER